MSWQRSVRRALLAYISMRAEHEELQEATNKAIGPRLSYLDGMPRAQGGLPRSAVERAATQREDIQARLAVLEERMLPIQQGLAELDQRELAAIHHLYFSLEGGDDEQADLEHGQIKDSAMHKIYMCLLEAECQRGKRYRESV